MSHLQCILRVHGLNYFLYLNILFCQSAAKPCILRFASNHSTFCFRFENKFLQVQREAFRIVGWDSNFFQRAMAEFIILLVFEQTAIRTNAQSRLVHHLARFRRLLFTAQLWLRSIGALFACIMQVWVGICRGFDRRWRRWASFAENSWSDRCFRYFMDWNCRCRNRRRRWSVKLLTATVRRPINTWNTG